MRQSPREPGRQHWQHSASARKRVRAVPKVATLVQGKSSGFPEQHFQPVKRDTWPVDKKL